MTSSYNTASRLVGQTYTGSAGVPGNLTYTDATGTTTYTRDARNRLSALSSSTLNATFTYDALGRRTGKTINGQSTTFLYDGLDTVKESGPEGEASYLRTLGIDEALSRTDAAGRLTYLPDALGCIPALADNAGGLLTTYTYAPFGDTATTGAPTDNPFQFTGRENDGTGLYYYRARYYDPTRSRFVSEDLLGLAGGTNPYPYVSDSPQSLVDPLGLRELQASLGAGGTIGSQPFPFVFPGPFFHGEVNVGLAVNLDDPLDTKVFLHGQGALMAGLGLVATAGGQFGGGYSSGVTAAGVSSSITGHAEAGAGWGVVTGGSVDFSLGSVGIAKGRTGVGYGLYAAGGPAYNLYGAVSIRSILNWLARAWHHPTAPCRTN